MPARDDDPPATDDGESAGESAAAGADPALKPARRRRQTVAQTIGGVLFGFEQQVWRTAPPPQELVHHARPDGPVAASDGRRYTIKLPTDAVLPPLADSPADKE